MSIKSCLLDIKQPLSSSAVRFVFSFRFNFIIVFICEAGKISFLKWRAGFGPQSLSWTPVLRQSNNQSFLPVQAYKPARSCARANAPSPAPWFHLHPSLRALSLLCLPSPVSSLLLHGGTDGRRRSCWTRSSRFLQQGLRFRSRRSGSTPLPSADHGSLASVWICFCLFFLFRWPPLHKCPTSGHLFLSVFYMDRGALTGGSASCVRKRLGFKWSWNEPGCPGRCAHLRRPLSPGVLKMRLVARVPVLVSYRLGSSL